jgi:hypothetical protein
MANPVLPVGRFSPSPGIYIDRTDNSISITGNMELYGDEATAARAHSIENSINSTWTESFPDGYSVECSVHVGYRGSGSTPSGVTQIEALITSGPSHVTDIPLVDRSMTLNAGETDAFTWTPAHEFGHILGLKDRYSEEIMSQIKGKFGGTRATTATPGYESNLMAVSGGYLESKNVGDLAKENATSPYWINDDDSVRDWIETHTIVEIRQIVISKKLQMISTLMSGWISSDDMHALGRICSSVDTRAEAAALQKGVNLLNFSDLGQRTKMRVFFAKMPGGYLGT